MRFGEVAEGLGFLPEYRVLRDIPFDILALCTTERREKTCTFVDNEEYIPSIAPNVVMIITTPEIGSKIDLERYGVAITADPRVFYFQLHNLLAENENYARTRTDNVISESAKISNLASIATENVRIEDNVLVEPFVTIYPNVHIGKNTIIRSGAKIGGVGFEFKHYGDESLSVRHLGGVEIGEHVEIQNNSCVDKAVYPWDDTIIGNHVKIDNLVHIAHGVKIGANTMIVANTGIGGRTVIGSNSWIGFGAIVRNGLNIGDDARVNMGAVVTKDVGNGQSVSGNFAIEHQKFLAYMKWKNSTPPFD